MNMNADQGCTELQDACASLPELVRMNYFHGQLITERDLRTEQDYFRARLRHANRCLHGYGVLCGLEVRPLPPSQECPPEDDELREARRRKIAEYDVLIAEEGDHTPQFLADLARMKEERERLKRELDELRPSPGGHEPARVEHRVELTCGAAIDCEGNDIIVRHAVPVDLDDLLKHAPRIDGEQAGEGNGDGGHDVHDVDEPDDQDDETRFAYLSICYQECGREPSRPFELDDCATSLRCHNARMVEAWRLTASWHKPPEDERCETCCAACRETCVLLARIRIHPGRPIRPEDIDHSVRRRFGLYEATVITGINWRHAFTYSLATADGLLGTDSTTGGLEIRFSRPVRAETLERGVVDIWRIEGGKGGRGQAMNMEAQLLVPPSGDGLVDRFVINNSSRERVQRGDRILVIVRTAFILDACCRAVEGAHLGGRVPRLPGDDEAAKAALDEEGQTPPSEACIHPPHGPVPWTTGAGGNFESWFYVSET